MRNLILPPNRSKRQKTKPPGNTDAVQPVQYPVGAGVIVRTQSQEIFISAEDDQAAKEFAECLVAADVSAVTVELRELEQWSPHFRWTAFQAIAETSPQVTLAGKLSHSAKQNLFVCCLSAIRNYEDLDHMVAIRQAMCEAAALVYPTQIGETVAKIREAYKRQHLPQPKKSELEAAIKNLARTNDGVMANEGPEGIARRYVASLASDTSNPEDVHVPRLLRYRETWQRFDGQVWREVSAERVETGVVQMLQVAGTGQATKPLLRDVMLHLQGLCSLVESRLEGPLWIDDAAASTSASPYVACRNGLLDLSPVLAGTGLPDFFNFSPRHFSAVQLGFDFDPTAKCPLWMQTIQQILPRKGKHDRRRERFQEFGGWALAENGPRMEKVCILLGTGANGKSTVLNVLEAVLGRDNVSHVALEHLSHSFRPSQMKGKLANICNDLNRVEKFHEGVLKQLVSGDALQIERKGIDAETFVPRAKLMYGTNSLPAINDRSSGVFRRLLIIPFTESFSAVNADKYLGTKLLGELPGIANWFLDGLIRLVKHGRFSACKTCDAIERQHQIDSDPFIQFFGEYCELDPNKSEELPFLFNIYKTFCKANNRLAVNSSEFARRLEEQVGAKCTRPDGPPPRRRILRGLKYVGSRHFA
ncbi:hypothetical protein ETAA8_35570 [Anatilimnocola aggregata]|uniref:SF3 helicase domain-containing protein n=1 Tax=Anatilimnocola aggregata TaxID=2528021 RepID=A0A517YE19_9BACT|nr:phage/plasmid primase, P4 family [Anatilimnocola aggregata]QDU28457.1 hypothetical protein ETAA8_35570 [Anatilimnocola aggregata]